MQGVVRNNTQEGPVIQFEGSRNDTDRLLLSDLTDSYTAPIVYKTGPRLFKTGGCGTLTTTGRHREHYYLIDILPWLPICCFTSSCCKVMQKVMCFYV